MAGALEEVVGRRGKGGSWLVLQRGEVCAAACCEPSTIATGLDGTGVEVGSPCRVRQVEAMAANHSSLLHVSAFDYRKRINEAWRALNTDADNMLTDEEFCGGMRASLATDGKLPALLGLPPDVDHTATC